MLVKVFSKEREVEVFGGFSLSAVFSVPTVMPRKVPRNSSKKAFRYVREVVVEKPEQSTSRYLLSTFVNDAVGGKTFFEDFPLRLNVFSQI